MGTYINITQEDFEEWLKEFGNFTQVKHNGTELVYSLKMVKTVRILVFSSIDNGNSRAKGKDAIRTIIQSYFDNKWKVVYRAGRTNRTTNWRINLGKKIAECISKLLLDENIFCSECGGAFIQRTGKHGDFWSCINWPFNKCNSKPNFDDGTNSHVSLKETVKPVLQNKEKNKEVQNATVSTDVCPTNKKQQFVSNSIRRQSRNGKTETSNEFGTRSRAGSFFNFEPSTDKKGNRRNQKHKNSTSGGCVKEKKLKYSLNDQQKEVVNHIDGPCMVSAAPGSGKTFCIVERIYRMIKNGIAPENIFATTFTKKAATEMNNRLLSKGVDIKKVTIRTLHAFCYRIIRYSKLFEGYEVQKGEEYSYILKDITGYKDMQWKGCDLTKVENFIAFCKNYLLRPENATNLPGFIDVYHGDERYVEAYFKAEEEKNLKKLLTFDDMLIEGVYILNDNKFIRDEIQGRYQYVIVDEYQDTNHAQNELIKIVSHPENNIMVVGDADQTLYEFRGAKPEFMLNFPEIYDARIIDMGVNYRSSPAIIDNASNLITHNEKRFSKEICANRQDKALIHVENLQDQDEEADYIADEIERLTKTKSEGIDFKDIFVLYRVNAQSRAIEEVFSQREIPHVVLGGTSFYKRKEVQDLLSYLKVINNPYDIKAGRRSLNRPLRFVKKSIIEEIADSVNKKKSFLDCLYEIGVERYHNQGCKQYFYLIQKLKEEWKMWKKNEPNISVGKLITSLVNKTGFIDFLQATEGKDTAENSRTANVGELIRSAERYTEIDKFLKFVTQQINLKKKKKVDINAVTCMTGHKSKGLESEVVFLTGANEGIIPHSNSEKPYEEERRLFYVMMTRAKNKLFVTYLDQMGLKNTLSLEPSRFLKEANLFS